MRKTKIVCTVGPATESEETLRELMKSGMDVARFNFSHSDYEVDEKRFHIIRKISDELGLHVATMLDTKGPEIRLKEFEDDKPVYVKDGEEFTLTVRDVVGTDKICSVTFANLPKDVTAGTKILINDGLIEMQVKTVTATDVICTVIHGGELKNHKGINIPGVKLSMPYISDADMKDLQFGAKMDFDFIAASFVRSGADVIYLRKFTEALGWSHVRIIAKIENSEGVANIDEILQIVDGIMVARGDLGVELPAEAIPNTQRRIVEKCICAKRPVIIATQMLYSMVKSPRPTRAEVSDVASAIYERVDAVMLSDETAMGDFPVQSVETMARIAREIERDETHFKPMIDMDMVSVNHEITAQLARSAVRASTNLPIKYVVLDTKTGRTGRYLAAFRGRKTVMAVCYQLHAQRILALSYGVVPILRLSLIHI